MSNLKKSLINKKNLLITGLAVVLAAVLFTGGTISYLSAKSDEVSNEFEAETNWVGITEDENDYEIIPGTTDYKNPYVQVYTTVNSFVYLVVEDTTDGLVEYSINDTIWTLLLTDEKSGVSIYYTTVSVGDEGYSELSLNVLNSNQVSYSADLENSDMLVESTDEDGNTTYTLKDGLELNFTAYIIQQAGFLIYDEDGSVDKDASALNAAMNLTLDQVSNVLVKVANGYTAVDEEADIDGSVSANYILASDVTLESALTLEEGTEVVLDLNAYTLTGAASTYAITSSGDLTITDSSEDGDGTLSFSKSNGLVSYGTLVIEGGTISSTVTYAVRSYGDFVMNGGSITGTTTVLYLSGDATGEMNGGSITATSSTHYAVRIYDGYDFTVNDGEIYGLVTVSGSEFTMNGGTISYSGASILVDISNSGSFEMNGGTISSSTTNSRGVGVADGSFTMNGGLISTYNGIYLYNADAVAVMNGGEINATNYGVTCSSKGGSFTMNDGVIEAGGSAAVYLGYTAGSFTWNGGTIIAASAFSGSGTYSNPDGLEVTSAE